MWEKEKMLFFSFSPHNVYHHSLLSKALLCNSQHFFDFIIDKIKMKIFIQRLYTCIFLLLPHNKIPDWSKLKAFTDYKMKD